ncbi:MAG: TonB-dependent receptor [Myxococcaceae bacterium]
MLGLVSLRALAAGPADGGAADDELALLRLPDGGIQLTLTDDVTVVGSLPDNQQPFATSPVVRDPSATVTVLDAREALREAKEAGELLATTPGAVVQDSGGVGQRKSLSLRGAAPNAVLVLLDGVPLSAPGEAMDLSRVPLGALDRLEVLRGGGSARYGPGAMGGVVNLVTRSPRDDASPLTSVFANASQGSFVTTRVQAGGTTELLGGDGLVVLHGLRTEGAFDYSYDAQPSLEGNPLTTLTRQNNDALQGGALARFRRRLGDTRLDVLAEGLVENRGLAGPVQNPSSTARQTSGRGTVSVRSRTRFESFGTVSTLASLRLDDLTLTGGVFGAGPYHQATGSAGAEASWTQVFANRHAVTALLTGGGDWLRSTGATPAQGRGGAMVADELWLFDGALALHGSARVDAAGRFVVFSPKLGATLDLPKGFSVRANVGQASRPPSFTELYVVQGTLLPNAELRPERALTADATVEWSHPKASVAVTGFGSLYEDLISYEYYPPNLARPYNFMAARVAGVEVEATARPFTWLEASAGYAWLDTQNLRDDPRYYLKSLPFRPRHRVHARVSGGPTWLRGHAEVLYQSAQFTNRTETLALPERAFVNVGATVTPWASPRISVSAELKNVLDVRTQDLDGYPLPPRAFFVTLGFQWDRAS